MKVTLNGMSIDLRSNCTVAGLVADRDLNPRQIAVEVNQELVRREEYLQVQLVDGDIVELVSLAGGG
ncbi:MAG: sulfur carrier protein ThiS [Pirellulaceae bacterium]|nr:sulfur carrier protein ThiS [Mariniblastus sp.]MDB4755743.1 sulfur carrier protein ThiS [Mariniblastus sp.]MDG2469813.1 sulfur carrier protein ThiS [Pirellulaceae bacterium]